MASVNAKINGQFVKIPNYTSADVDHIQYDGTRTFQDNTLGKKVKDIDATVVAHSQEIVNKYSKPASGIPSTDMSSSVKSSLFKADTSVQPYVVYDKVGVPAAQVDKTTACYLMKNEFTEYGTINRIDLVQYSASNDTVDLYIFTKVSENTYQLFSATSLGIIGAGEQSVACEIVTPNVPYYIGFSNNIAYHGTGDDVAYAYLTSVSSSPFTVYSWGNAKFHFRVYVNGYFKKSELESIFSPVTQRISFNETNLSLNTIYENTSDLLVHGGNQYQLYIIGRYSGKKIFKIKYKVHSNCTFNFYVISTDKKVLSILSQNAIAGYNEAIINYPNIPNNYYIGFTGDANTIYYGNNQTGSMNYGLANIGHYPTVGESLSFTLSGYADFSLTIKTEISVSALENSLTNVNPLSDKIIFLAGDSRSSTDYTFYGTTLSNKTGATVLVKGDSGKNVAYGASNAYFSSLTSNPHDFAIWIPGGNDSGDSGSVGTFNASSPNGIAGESVVTETDISQDYSGTYFVQAIDHTIRKYKSLFYDWKTLNNGHKPTLIMCTDLPQKRNNATSPFSIKENWERKVNAIKECCEKNNVICLDLYHDCHFDMSYEPYWVSPTDKVTNNGLYFMDGLHPNQYGIDIITSLEVQKMLEYLRLNN